MLYFDGRGGWEILPDKTIADLAGGELKFVQKYLRDFHLCVWLADRDSRFEIMSPEPNIVRIKEGSAHSRNRHCNRSSDRFADVRDNRVLGRSRASYEK